MLGEDNFQSVESKVDLSQLQAFSASLLSHVRRVSHRFTCYRKLIFQFLLMRITKNEFEEKEIL